MNISPKAFRIRATAILLAVTVALVLPLAHPGSALASSTCSFLDFDSPGARFEAYQVGGQASLLPFVGIRTYGNGSTLNTGRCFSDPTAYPNALQDDARDLLLLHPGTFATLSKGVALAYPVDRTGRFRLSGSFARANNFRNAGNGVYVAVFVNSDDAHPLFSGVIGSNHNVDANNPFGGTGVLSFNVTADLSAGDVVRFAVFANGDGTFDVTAVRALVDALDVTIDAPESAAVCAVGAPVTFTGTVTDLVGDSHTASWHLVGGALDAWIDGAVSAPTSADDPRLETKQVSATYAFPQAGVYRVSLTIRDQACNSASTDVVGPDELAAMVVVYDPNGGFVTGGGWITSLPGAYATDPALTGKASFGFVSKYERGANVPTGNTEFKFRLASFDFRSTSYDWLVVGGAKAQYKGWGTVNEAVGYRFLLTAWDGERPGGGGLDGFRIKIWSDATGEVVYDNVMGAGDTSDATTALGGGSVTIHRE